jgi:hypothetical protein
MDDVLFILLTIALFAVTAALVPLFEKLRR